jgi:hypothetical protein
LADADILATLSHIGSDGWRATDPQQAIFVMDTFLRDDSVGAVGHRRSREDAVRAPRAQTTRLLASRGATRCRQPQTDGEVSTAHRIAVHRRLIETGKIEPRLERLGKDATNTLVQR